MKLYSVKQFHGMINEGLEHKISLHKTYELVKTPGFPAILVGESYYVVADRIDEWLDSAIRRKGSYVK